MDRYTSHQWCRGIIIGSVFVMKGAECIINVRSCVIRLY
jgi:hypothetical protein